MADEIIDLTPAAAGRAARPARAGGDLGDQRWAGSGECPGGMALRQILFILAGAVAFCGGVYAAKAAPPEHRTLAWGGTGGTVAVLVVAGLLKSRRGERIEVAAYEHGLVYHDGIDRHTVRWAEVATVTEDRLDVYDEHGTKTQRVHNLLLATRGGDTHPLEVGDIEDSEDFAALVHELTLPHLLPRVVEKLNAGRPVHFGPLVLHPEGLARGEDELPWDEMAAARVENGVLVVARRGDRTPWCQEACGVIPNVQVLLHLIKARAQAMVPPPVAEGQPGRPGASRYSVIDRYKQAAAAPRIGY